MISATDVSSVEANWREQVYAGSNVLSITAANAAEGGKLDAGRCDAMRSISGVRSAGAVLRTYDVFARALPDDRLTLVEVTPGYLQVAYPRDPRVVTASSVSGASVSEGLGVTDDSTISYGLPNQVGEFAIHVDVATSLAARREPLDNVVMSAVAGVGTTYECLVESQPGSVEAVANAAQMWFSPVEVRVSPELPGNPLVTEPGAELQKRFSQWVPLAFGVALSAILMIVWWSRRADYASYRAFGLSSPQLLLLLLSEAAVTFWLPLTLGYAFASFGYASTISPVVARLLLNDYLALILTTSLVPLLGLWLLGARSAFEVSKGR